MTWADVAMIAIGGAVTAVWWIVSPAARARRSVRRDDRRERRAARRGARLVAAAEADARQAAFDTIHRHHAIQRRLIMAGLDPNLAGPVRMPGDDYPVPVWRSADATRRHDPSM